MKRHQQAYRQTTGPWWAGFFGLVAIGILVTIVIWLGLVVLFSLRDASEQIRQALP